MPSPHAWEMSRRACALTRSATASFGSTKCRFATYDSSCPDTPGMCLATSYGPMLVPLTKVVST